jgi:hypothetical protein
MPIHDWTRVQAGIFHHFHHQWIAAMARALNHGLLPQDYYALAEQFAGGFGPDVLTLQGTTGGDSAGGVPGHGSSLATLRLPTVGLQPTAETDMAFYRRKQNVVAIRHVSGDGIVAVIEVASPGNKAGRRPLRAFVEKAADLLEAGIHLLIIDLLPPSRRDPNGIHAEIWQEIAGASYAGSPDRPLTLASYDAGIGVRAYVVPTAVGASLVDMPLFLAAGQAVMVPLEPTYQAAYDDVPMRWQKVLEAPGA